MSATKHVAVVLTALAALLVGCTTAPSTQQGQVDLVQRADATLNEMSRVDPGLGNLAAKSYGYALFPEVAKGGLVFGGAYGRGVVYEQGQHIGYADLSQASFGLQVGGQSYSELVVFQDKVALEGFKRNRVELAAAASAVILKTGAAESAQFVDGVAVFIRPIGGAMAEAAIGGQQLTYVPK